MEIPLKYNHRDCKQIKSQIHETLDVFMLVLSGESTITARHGIWKGKHSPYMCKWDSLACEMCDVILLCTLVSLERLKVSCVSKYSWTFIGLISLHQGAKLLGKAGRGTKYETLANLLAG